MPLFPWPRGGPAILSPPRSFRFSATYNLHPLDYVARRQLSVWRTCPLVLGLLSIFLVTLGRRGSSTARMPLVPPVVGDPQRLEVAFREVDLRSAASSTGVPCGGTSLQRAVLRASARVLPRRSAPQLRDNRLRIRDFSSPRGPAPTSPSARPRSFSTTLSSMREKTSRHDHGPPCPRHLQRRILDVVSPFPQDAVKHFSAGRARFLLPVRGGGWYLPTRMSARIGRAPRATLPPLVRIDDDSSATFFGDLARDLLAPALGIATCSSSS